MAELVTAVEAALAPRWSVAGGPARRTRMTVLDTFDWRLHRSGATAVVTGPPAGTRSLVLTTPDATLTAPLAEEPETRLVPGDVPPGPLHDHLAAVLDVRALLPLTTVTATEREVRVLDDERKTVVRLHVGADAVRVQELKGYAGPARAVREALQGAGITVLDAPDVPALLVAAGHEPGRLPGRLDPAPTATTPAPVAVALVLRSFLEQLEANVPGAVADLDPEFVHDLRIAVRRSRSAIKLAGDALPADAAARAAAELKRLGDVTTPVRDLDVHLLDLPALAGRLEAFAPDTLDPFAAHLARHRTGEQRTMARALTAARTTRFLTWWREVLDATVDGEAGDAAPVADLAAARLARAHKRVLKLGGAITPDSPAEDLHTLRKRAKELRYTVDLFAPVLEPAPAKAVVGELKGLQDVLGAFQDSEVQRDALVRIAADMTAEQTARRPVPVTTLLALGELAAHLAADQTAARARFAERFARFTRPAVGRHVATLTGGRA